MGTSKNHKSCWSHDARSVAVTCLSLTNRSRKNNFSRCPYQTRIGFELVRACRIQIPAHCWAAANLLLPHDSLIRFTANLRDCPPRKPWNNQAKAKKAIALPQGSQPKELQKSQIFSVSLINKWIHKWQSRLNRSAYTALQAWVLRKIAKVLISDDAWYGR